MASTKERITRTLTDTFRPLRLEVVDESERHKGHAGARPEGETHFRVRIVAQAFAGMTRLEMHRAINKALEDEIANGVHALAIEAKGG